VASLCLSMAQLWSWGQESRATVAAIALSLVCGLLGIMIPWYGFLFPATATTVAVLTALPELKQR
jgi:ABC-type Mn2+/Zn2+ transport system permease subunit